MSSNLTNWLNEKYGNAPAKFFANCGKTINNINEISHIVFSDDAETHIPNFEDHRTVTIFNQSGQSVEMIYTSNEDNNDLYTKQDFASYLAELAASSIPAAMLGILNEDKIDKIEEKIQHGIWY